MTLDLDSFRRAIVSLVYEYLGRTGVRFMEFLGNCLIALVILIIGFKLCGYIVKLCRKVFERSKMDLMIQSFLLSCMKIGLKILVVFIAVQQVGVQASSIIAVIGSAGLALGLSLQGSLSNIAGGVILLVIKPFQVGDYIIEDSSGKEGTVQSIGIMYTKLSSMDNKAILIPNGKMSSASITNVTNQDKRRVDLLVGIEYEENIQRVKDILSDVIQSETVLLKEDPVKIYVSEFRESCIEIGMRYWVRTEDYWESRWRVLEKIKKSFDEAGITIPYNKLDVNVITQQ